MNLSKHFTLEELTRTDTGLDNTPEVKHLGRLQNLANNLELVRAICGNKPIKVTSAFRSEAVNRKVGGSDTSAHKDGDAADIKIPGLDNKKICSMLIRSGIKFDQLIDENKNGSQWVHISFAPKLRQQYLIFSNGRYEVHK